MHTLSVLWRRKISNRPIFIPHGLYMNCNSPGPAIRLRVVGLYRVLDPENSPDQCNQPVTQEEIEE
jgi:hypothetical protein